MSNSQLAAGLSPSQLLVYGSGLLALGYLAYRVYKPSGDTLVNPNIQKDAGKVVHIMDVEDLGEKTAFCRCWRSKKFPYCDGTHTKHNQENHDNVGPLVLKKSA